MNKENILLVANAIEAGSIEGLGFNLYSFLTKASDPFLDTSGRKCGTIACIGGWANALRVGYEPSGEYYLAIDDMERVHGWDAAREWLGLNDTQAFNLFAPYDLDCVWTLVTPKVAAGVLRHLAETGEIKWPTYEELENAKEEA